MALLLLVTSSGLSMDVHFCQGKFKRASIFGKAKTCQEVNNCLIKCGKQVNSYPSETSCSRDESHKDCCKNESFILDLDFEVSDIVSTDLSKKQKHFLTAFTFNYVLNLVLTNEEVSKFKTYRPPPLERDLAVFFQVFRL